MTKNLELKYAEGTSSPFYKDVKQRVEEYLSTKPTGQMANSSMIFKTIFITVAYLGLYTLLITNNFTALTGIIYCFLLGLLHPLFFINIGHDAMHNTYVKKGWLTNYCPTL